MAAIDTTPGTGSMPAVPRATAPGATPKLGPVRAASSGCCWPPPFVAILNETTMGVAIPHLIDRPRHHGAVAAQWLTTAFMLTMAVVIPITGFLLRRFTTRTMFVAAMGLFSPEPSSPFLAPGFQMLLVAPRRPGVRHRDHDAAAHDDPDDRSCRRHIARPDDGPRLAS